MKGQVQNYQLELELMIQTKTGAEVKRFESGLEFKKKKSDFGHLCLSVHVLSF